MASERNVNIYAGTTSVPGDPDQDSDQVYFIQFFDKYYGGFI